MYKSKRERAKEEKKRGERKKKSALSRFAEWGVRGENLDVLSPWRVSCLGGVGHRLLKRVGGGRVSGISSGDRPARGDISSSAGVYTPEMTIVVVVVVVLLRHPAPSSSFLSLTWLRARGERCDGRGSSHYLRVAAVWPIRVCVCMYI